MSNVARLALVHLGNVDARIAGVYSEVPALKLLIDGDLNLCETRAAHRYAASVDLL